MNEIVPKAFPISWVLYPAFCNTFSTSSGRRLVAKSRSFVFKPSKRSRTVPPTRYNSLNLNKSNTVFSMLHSWLPENDSNVHSNVQSVASYQLDDPVIIGHRTTITPTGGRRKT